RGGTEVLTSKETAVRRLANWMRNDRVPYRSLDSDNIPTLTFGGRSRLRFGTVLLARLGSESVQNRAWLRQMEPGITYGAEHRANVVAVGLAASALRKLGLPKSIVAGFSPAFVNGMTASWRARALGDSEVNAPTCWDWGNCNNPVDLVIIIYGVTQ